VCCSIACSFCNVFELWFVLLFSDLYFTLSHLDTSMCSCQAVPTGHATFTRLLVSCVNRTSLFLATFTLLLFGWWMHCWLCPCLAWRVKVV
jgi:hypothetical protein